MLGSCLIDPKQEIISDCTEVGIVAEAFYKPANRVIFQVILDLYAQNIGIDEVTVLDALSSRQVGSIEWLKKQQRLTELWKEYDMCKDHCSTSTRMLQSCNMHQMALI